MADQSTSNEEGQTEPTEGAGGETEQKDAAAEAFFKRIDERLDAAIDRGVKRHLSRQKQTTGTARTGRTTLPGILAELMGGPFTPESKRQQQ